MFENIYDYIRFALYGVLIFVAFTLYQHWNQEHVPPVTTAINQVQNVPNNPYIPEISKANTTPVASAQPNTTTTAATDLSSGQIIHVITDVFDLSIDTHGGNVIEAKLLKYPAVLHSATPFELLNNNPNTRYIAQSGLLSNVGPDTPAGQANYTADNTEYTLPAGQNSLEVQLHWQNDQGLKVTKTYTFIRGSYDILMTYAVTNGSSQPWSGHRYLQLLRSKTPPENSQGGGLSNLSTFFGAAISTTEKPFQKITFKQMDQNNLNLASTDGWLAMLQHYFITAWVPNGTAENAQADDNSLLSTFKHYFSTPTPPSSNSVTYNYYSKVLPDSLYAVGLIGPELQAQPGATISSQAKLYTGPEDTEQLQKIAPKLNLTIDYGLLWIFAVPLFWLMQKIYNVVGNWGWSIVILTIIVKLLFYKLSAKSYRSMSMLKKLQPRIEMLKERFGDDKQKFTQATLDLYRQEKVNPMSGCLPIIIQIPVFISLYWVLVESVQLRQAPFILWIHDLSAKDPYYILPLLMGISFFIQQRLNPPPPDPMQAKMMMLMPIIFTVLFLKFPAGLMLYWFVNNTLSILQQWYIMRTIGDAKPKKAKA